MIHALCNASNLRARAEKIKKPRFNQTHKVTFHIITSLGVVFSLSTLISKLSCAKIIGWFKWDQLRWQKWAAFEKSWFSGRRYFSRLRRSWRLRRQISLDYYTIPAATQASWQTETMIFVSQNLHKKELISQWWGKHSCSLYQHDCRIVSLKPANIWIHHFQINQCKTHTLDYCSVQTDFCWVIKFIMSGLDYM